MIVLNRDGSSAKHWGSDSALHWFYADDYLAPYTARDRGLFKSRLEGYLEAVAAPHCEGFIIPFGGSKDPAARPQRVSMAVLNLTYILKKVSKPVLIGIDGGADCGTYLDLHQIHQRLNSELVGGCFVGDSPKLLQELRSTPHPLLRAVITPGLESSPLKAYLKEAGFLPA